MLPKQPRIPIANVLQGLTHIDKVILIAKELAKAL